MPAMLDKLLLKKELDKMQNDLIKWMFIFWVGQLAAMVVIAKLF